ncbi:unnamed protein product [Schistosoma rodhaini]|nr:unnamed protein product [Schistosoma rodhaini]
MQNEVNEMKAIRKDLIRDLVQTEKAARNTSDSNKRGILEREVEDLINGINALEEKLENSQKNFNEVLDNLRFASPELKAAEERNLDTTDKYFNALNDHLEILKNLEIRRIDVLELLSSKERIQMYESILQEEYKYLSMLASTKNSSLTASNGKSLSERKMSLKQLEKEYKQSKWDLVQTEKEARNTSDSNKRGILEREVEDLINEINALEGEY